MSQAKVDRYKEEKKNRKKTMAKEKRLHLLAVVCGWLLRQLWAGCTAACRTGSIWSRDTLHNCIHVRIDHDGFCFRVTPLQYAMKISTESVSTCIPNFCMRPFKNSSTWKSANSTKQHLRQKSIQVERP